MELRFCLDGKVLGGACVEGAPEFTFGLAAFETSIKHPRKMLSKHKSRGQEKVWMGGLGAGDTQMPLQPLPQGLGVADTPPQKPRPRSWQGLSEGVLARQMLPISVVLHQNHPVGTTKTTDIITTKGKRGFS